MWVIFGAHLRKWFNGETGWVDTVDRATRYNYTEKVGLSNHMPFGGVWRMVEPSDKPCAGFKS